MPKTHPAHFRYVTQVAMQWLLEPESGIYTVRAGERRFDVCILDYQHDVWNVLRRLLDPRELQAVVLVYQEGLTAAEALAVCQCHTNQRPDKVIAKLERRIGIALCAAGLDDPAKHFAKHTSLL